jgi:hypothetical protein
MDQDRNQRLQDLLAMAKAAEAVMAGLHGDEGTYHARVQAQVVLKYVADKLIRIVASES